MEKIPYSRTVRAVSTGAAQFFLMDERIKSGHWLFIQNLAVEDETTAPSKIRVGRGTDERNVHYWEEEPAPALGVLFTTVKPLHQVPEGNRVIVRFDGTVAGDRLAAFIDGYLTPKVEAQAVTWR